MVQMMDRCIDVAVKKILKYQLPKIVHLSDIMLVLSMLLS